MFSSQLVIITIDQHHLSASTICRPGLPIGQHHLQASTTIGQYNLLFSTSTVCKVVPHFYNPFLLTSNVIRCSCDGKNTFQNQSNHLDNFSHLVIFYIVTSFEIFVTYCIFQVFFTYRIVELRFHLTIIDSFVMIRCSRILVTNEFKRVLASSTTWNP